MEKKIIRTEILYRVKSNDPFTLGEILNIAKNNAIELQISDEIHIEFDNENNTYDFSVFRVRQETDDEAKLREEREELRKIEIKAHRYKTYLELKKEFDNDQEVRKE